MFSHPHITASVAANRRRDQLACAEAGRLARTTARRPADSRRLTIAPRLAWISRRAAMAAAAFTARTA